MGIKPKALGAMFVLYAMCFCMALLEDSFLLLIFLNKLLLAQGHIHSLALLCSAPH